VVKRGGVLIKKDKSKILKISIFGILLLLISACSIGEAKGKKPSPDWSKGVPVATNVRGSSGFAVEPDSQILYLVYPYDTPEGPQLQFQRMDQIAQPVVTRDLDIPAERIRRTRLLLAEQGHVHLFWETREPSQGWVLWHALLSEDGELANDPTQLSSDDFDVGQYEAVPAQNGRAIVVWDSQNNPGIFGIEIGPAGQIAGDPVMLTEEGSSPSLVVGSDGSLDLAWVDAEGIQYAHFADGLLSPTSGTKVADVQIGTGDSLFGPVIGKTDGWIYILSARLSRSGLAAGQASTSFTSFPEGEPASAAKPQVISVLPLEEQPLRPYDGIYSLYQFVSEEFSAFRSDYVYEPNPLKIELDELAVGVASKQLSRQDEVVQPNTLLFEDGEFKGYSFSGKTPGFSSDPIVAADRDRNLYMSWRDGSDGELIFLATTNPEMAAALDQIEGGDLINTALQGGIEGVATILLFPLAIPWIVPGYVLIGLWKVYRDYESLADLSSWIVLAVALILFEITKFIFLPTIVTYVPFSAWIDIPNGLTVPLRIGYPIVTLALGILFAEINRRRGSESTLLYYTIVIFTDLLLTLAVYGVAFLGVF
jgi:hypothetical protein